MSEEEQKAMLNLEHIVEYWEPDDENDEFANIEYNSIKVAVNLIYKLRKENEELKRKTYKAYINDKGEVQFVFDNYISKDKIRAKIKELEKLKADIHSEHCTYWYKNKIKVLEELLGDDE